MSQHEVRRRKWVLASPLTAGTAFASRRLPASESDAAFGWSEDCLYLNVWTMQLTPEAKQPVIVFFHGGGNQAGYSQFTPLGPALSRLGVVIVSANYRLGPFGFFAFPALTEESEHHSSGNFANGVSLGHRTV